VHNGPSGPAITIPDAQFLFHPDFARAGPDLIVTGPDGEYAYMIDYFRDDKRSNLVSFNGVALSAALK